VPFAEGADTIVVKDGDRVLSVAASDATIEPVQALDPTRPLFTVRFDGGDEIAADDRAWHACYVAAAAESVGVAARVTAMSVDYAKERKQFGRPIGSYQAVSHACAQMLLEVEGARSAVYWAAWALDHEPEAAPLAAACAKAYAGDAGRRVPRSALQVHGGIGFTWEHDLHFFLKRGEANAHAYGSGAAHREQIAALAGL
jgi:alkylation response protein AidB-like acyl-CoA dehydrogenase